MILLIALVSGCQTAPLTQEKVAEIRSLEIDSAVRLSLEGQLLYEEEKVKLDGYQYCSDSIRFAERGEFRRAIRAATKALFLGKSSRDRYLVALAKRDLAYAYILAGYLDNAEKYAREALSHSRKGKIVSRVYKILGDVELRRKRPEDAIEYYNLSLTESDPWSKNFVSISLANAYIANNEPRRAREILDNLEPSGKLGMLVSRSFGNAALAEGRYGDALAAYEASIVAAGGADFAYHRMWALDGAARASLMLDNRKKALDFYLSAVETAEDLRPTFRSEEFKSGFFGEIQSVYNAAVRLLAEDGEDERALQISERSRSRALLDLFRNRVQFSVDSDAIAPARGEPVSVSKIRASLPDSSVLVEYHVLGDRTLAWVVRKSGVRIHALDVEREELTEQVRQFRQSIVSRSPRTTALAGSLHDVLLGPLELNNKETIVIVAHGPLHYLPFQALHTGQAYLIEERPISYAPSASAFVKLLERGDEKRRKVVAFGNPELGNPLLDLPGALKEVRQIQALHTDTEVYLRSQATKQNFLDRATAGNVVHVAAHAQVDEIDPLYSFIRLAGTENTSGDLEAHEMYRMDFTNTSLVALSACDSGLGNVTKGDEIWGFTRTFLGAGVRGVLVSLWPVSDESTQRLMATFYKRLLLADGMDALRQAQVTILNDDRYSHPYFWAPFNLVGYTESIGGTSVDAREVLPRSRVVSF